MNHDLVGIGAVPAAEVGSQGTLGDDAERVGASLTGGDLTRGDVDTRRLVPE